MGFKHDTLRLLPLPPYAGTQPIRPTCTHIYIYIYIYSSARASRIISQKANLGTMDSPGEFCRLVSGNVSLTLCQALVVGFLASVLALCFSLPQKGYVEGSHALLLAASCMTTAFLSSVVLGGLGSSFDSFTDVSHSILNLSFELGSMNWKINKYY